MATCGKNHVSTLLGAAGLAAVAIVALYVVVGATKRRTSKTAESGGESNPHHGVEDEPWSSSSEIERSSMLSSNNQHVVSAPQLKIPAAAPNSSTLVICQGGEVDASLAATFARESRSAGAVVNSCSPDVEYLCSHARSAAGTYDAVLVIWAGVEGSSGVVLGEVLKLLRDGGEVSMVIAVDDEADTAAIITKRALTFAGFIGVGPYPGEPRLIGAKRPSWEVGASAPLRLSFRKAATAATAVPITNGASGSEGKGKQTCPPPQSSKPTWKISLEDEEGFGATRDDDDLVDEDALLDASAPVKRATEKDTGDCSKRRRACKDCSCGRAQLEEEGALPSTPVTLSNLDEAVTSSCGNCAKGDAFRCAGCPFLGKPAFERGQERQVLLADLGTQQDA